MMKLVAHGLRNGLPDGMLPDVFRVVQDVVEHAVRLAAKLAPVGRVEAISLRGGPHLDIARFRRYVRHGGSIGRMPAELERAAYSIRPGVALACCCFRSCAIRSTPSAGICMTTSPVF